MRDCKGKIVNYWENECDCDKCLEEVMKDVEHEDYMLNNF